MSIVQPRSSHATLAHPPPDPAARAALRGRSWLRARERACDHVLSGQERARHRQHQEALNDHMLRDIGLSRADIMAETTKRFWER
jgi:uncharacterized protein YjiS (DUF1127 family)